MNSKECKKCGQLKPLSEFSKNKNEPDGLKRYCKQCVSLESKKYREQHRDEINHRKIISYRKSKEFADERTAAQLKEETRICSVCSVEKHITGFYKCGNGGFRTYCKLCANIKSQEYQSNNRDSIIMKKRNTIWHTKQR